MLGSSTADELDRLQSRLTEHFGLLCTARRDDGLPVFALEHGLEQADVDALQSFLKSWVTAGLGPNARHWLVWVVYATEQGYDYDGGEYWHTFERRMPRWDRSWRPTLRAYFVRFNKTFAGLKPTGAWASCFSIIAWPITHAILPRDLQAQLAGALYSLRHELVRRLDGSPAEIGRFVSRWTHDGSSRFRNLLEQEETAGRIILALLDDRQVTGPSAIHPGTLARIVRDLEGARHARQWLRDTRRAVEVSRLRGAQKLSPRQGSSDTMRDPEAERTPPIRPKLVLRRSGPDAWTALVEVPDFRGVAALSPELTGFLRRTRCSVAGTSGKRPPGWLLTGSQRRVLEHWPASDAPVVAFDARNPAIEHLLASEGRMSPGPVWLFRVGADGQAVEVVGRTVRPGASYVLAARETPPHLSGSAEVTLGCSGVRAVRLDLPASISEALADEIRAAGLGVARTVRLWPVGLPAVSWDGEGAVEWLEGERPCFGMEHDHVVERYEISLDGGQRCVVPAAPPGQAAFVRLPHLPSGIHELAVSALCHDPSEPGRGTMVAGRVSITVRPPRLWVGGTTGHSGLVVSSEPPEPTLDEFCEGLTELKVLGPPGRQIAVCLELLDGGGGQLAMESLGRLTLPLGSETWRRTVQAFVAREKSPWAYLQAASGRMIVDGEELGVAQVPLCRNVAPVRWVWQSTRGSTLLRLVDDHDADEPIEVAFHGFARPSFAEVLPAADAVRGLEPRAPGGLFVARYGSDSQSLVVSMPKVAGGLQGLLVEPVVDAVDVSHDGAVGLLSTIVAWSEARLVGTLAAERRERVVSRLKEQLFGLLCGRSWAAAEEGFRRSGPTSPAVERLVGCFHPQRSFATVIVHNAAKYARMPLHVRLREFAALAGRYGVSGHHPCKCALDLCEVLDGRRRISGQESQALVAALWDYPAPVAGARLISLLAGLSPASRAADLRGVA